MASILLVDDCAANVGALESVLSSLGHRLVRASSGSEALAAVQREAFAVILVDVHTRGLVAGDTAGLFGELFRQADRAEQQLTELAQRAEAARAEAEAANRMKDQFLATVSHELRTPLNAILGWVRLMRSDRLSRADKAKALETIERNTRIQTQLVEDLLDVSRIVTGKLRLDVRQVNPSEVVQNAIEATRLTADAKGVLLCSKIEPLGGLFLEGDPGRLEQVVWNLLANAIKFTPKDGHVDLTVRREGAARLAIEVADTGHGIEPELLPHVFDRFRQGDSSSRRQQGGLGLGLAIVRNIVELHGGTVLVDSPGYGQGARFTVLLPLVETSAAPPAPRKRDSDGFNQIPLLRGVRAVIVDDDDDARELMAIVLEGHGAEVTLCATAAAAFEEVRARPPDLLLSDIGMPGENGYDLIRRVRALPPDEGGEVIAIALTGFARSEDGAQSLEAGFQVHLTKPVDPAHLLAEVHRLRGHAKLRA